LTVVAKKSRAQIVHLYFPTFSLIRLKLFIGVGCGLKDGTAGDRHGIPPGKFDGSDDAHQAANLAS
jgi:hypothetical protein